MARQPVISWLQPQSYSGEPDVSFGAIDEVNMSNNANDSQIANGRWWGIYPFNGICAMRNESSECASIYQLNSLGDLFSHQVSFSRSQTKSYYTAVQAKLPIPVDAMVPEYDTESMQTFITLLLKFFDDNFRACQKIRKINEKR
ncbi:hypothetical protein Plhal304r1_c004g0016451 [Plasmopara halstedii]